jgi:MFS family permease
MADVGDQAWIVMLAYTAAQSGDALIATLTVAAGTIPRAILDLVGGAVADRLPTRPLLVGAASGRVAVLAAGLLALLEFPGHTIPIMVVVAVFFGAADAVHKPAVGTMPRQLVPLAQIVRAASVRQLVNRMALLFGPVIAGLGYAAVHLTGSMTGLLVVFAVAAALMLFVRTRYQREPAEHQSVVSSTRAVLGYLRQDLPARALVGSLVGLNFFVIPVINAGIALRVTAEHWGADVLGVLTAAVGAGAVVGTAITLRVKPRYPMRFALALLVVQGGAIAAAGLAPMIGVGISLGLVGLTAGLSSPMLSGTAQSIVDPAYLGRIFALLGFADDALIPFALLGYGALAKGIGVQPATVLCGIGMALLMSTGLLRPTLRNLRLEAHGTELRSAGQPESGGYGSDAPPVGDDQMFGQQQE